MDRSKSYKLKAIFTNPWQITWPEIGGEQTMQLMNALWKEFQENAMPEIRVEVKRQKIENANMINYSKNQLILGINKIVENIDKVDCVIMMRSDANESILEPLLILCKNKGVKAISASYELGIEKLRDIAGVKRLAAFALPKIHCFKLTRLLIDQFQPKPAQSNHLKPKSK
ncbi:unnamed protein product [Blepharisma stoltei]|uniref:Uncharacterized protein n=1 Tax=Blepharisma stoltei TaxID=1481888 RepID=A0AAU9JWM6_9CILI|nr:unnamed protein product [Blepharisma stoltei]